jgi:hypothetical protein
VAPEAAAELDERERKLWLEYVRLDTGGRRNEALVSLRHLIEGVHRYQPQQRTAWVEAICTEHWSGPVFPAIEGKLLLRHPLLVELVFPDLLEGHRAGRPGYARWLALFSLTPTGGIDAKAYDELRLRGMPEDYPAQLLWEALALDANDTQAAHALLRHLEDKFDYRTHHVPEFVIADEATEWRRELEEFERLSEQHPTGHDYGFELAGWRLHCEAWEEFLDCSDEFDSYADFLAQRPT